MTEHKFSLEMMSDEKILSALIGIDQLGRWRARDAGQPAHFELITDTALGQLSIETISLGLIHEEAVELAPAIGELVRNAIYGLAGAKNPETEITGKKVDYGFAEAIRSGLDPTVRLDIEFDDETRRGKIEVSHPIIPEITPELNLERVRRERPGAVNRKTKGGIFQIEKGLIDWKMKNAGFNHSLVQTADEAGSQGEPRRRVWLDFWQK